MSDETKNKDVLLLIGLIILAFAILISNTFIQNSYTTNLPVEENGGIPVNVQDQTTRPFDIKVNQILDATYSLSTSPTINSYDLTLTDVTGLNIGDDISFLEQNGIPQLLFGEILDINANTITLDSPVPTDFTTANTTIFTFSNDLTVDGSTSTEIFSIDNFFNESIDIVRFIFHCTDNTVMHDGLFCSNPELTRGVVLRKKLINGDYINYFNIKNNGNWAEIAYDSQYTEKGKPPDDTYGFSSRLTYGGQSKHGVVIRLNPGESIEFLIQDDLTGVTTANLMVEGHFIQN